MRILIVDDDVMFADAVSAVLAEHVTEAAYDARAALTRLHEAPFDLVVCDLELDETNGRELRSEACQRFPAMRDRFLFMTGGRLTIDDAPLIRKPFELHELRRAIATMPSAPA